jgi:nitric oxide reductase large subunit
VSEAVRHWASMSQRRRSSATTWSCSLAALRWLAVTAAVVAFLVLQRVLLYYLIARPLRYVAPAAQSEPP